MKRRIPVENLNFKGEEINKSERRKVRKVIVERKRRERIDRCMDQLKHFLLESNESTINQHHHHHHPQNEVDRGTNLEKADILELTVDYLRLLRSQNDQHRVNGYRRCAREAADFVRRSSLDKDVGRRLETFLSVRQSHAVANDRPNRTTADTRPAFGTTAGFHEPFQEPSSGSWQENFRHLNMCFGANQQETRNTSPTGIRNSPPMNNVQSAEVDTTIKDDRGLTPYDTDNTRHHASETQQEIQTMDAIPGNQNPQETAAATPGCSAERPSSADDTDNGHPFDYRPSSSVDRHRQATKPQNKSHPLIVCSIAENVELKHDEFIWRPW